MSCLLYTSNIYFGNNLDISLLAVFGYFFQLCPSIKMTCLLYTSYGNLNRSITSCSIEMSYNTACMAAACIKRAYVCLLYTSNLKSSDYNGVFICQATTKKIHYLFLQRVSNSRILQDNSKTNTVFLYHSAEIQDVFFWTWEEDKKAFGKDDDSKNASGVNNACLLYTSRCV